MKNKTLKGISIALVFALLLGCSFAYFTDYATTQANGTAGTVAVSMDSNINLLNEDGMDILNPGDQRDAGFTVTNEGNKSIDVRTTIALTAQSNTGYDLAFSGDGATQSEFDLYLRSDVELVEGYGYMPKADAQPLQVKSIDQDVITYVLPEYSLNGNADRYDEVETIDGVNEFARANDYVLVFKGEAGNEWQNSSISLDVIVEAKQHENTGAGWDIVAQENVSLGSIDKSAVKGETVITEIIGNQGGNGSESEGEGSVSFRLTNSDDGNGVVGAEVTLVRDTGSAISTLSSSYEVVGKAFTDDNGEITFNNLSDGDYAIMSNVIDEGALDVTVSNGSSESLDYSAALGNARTLTFKIEDQNGNPVEGAYVVYEYVGLNMASGKSGADGITNTPIYQYTTPNGDYVIDKVYLQVGNNVVAIPATVLSSRDFTVNGDTEVTVQAQVKNVTLTLTDANGAAIENGRIYVNVPNSNSVWVFEATDANGQIALTLEDGTYTISASRIINATVGDSIALENSVITVNGVTEISVVEVNNTQPDEGGEGSGDDSGTVEPGAPVTFYVKDQNNEPIANQRVTIYQGDAYIGSVVTDANGCAEYMYMLIDGAYTAKVWSNDWQTGDEAEFSYWEGDGPITVNLKMERPIQKYVYFEFVNQNGDLMPGLSLQSDLACWYDYEDGSEDGVITLDNYYNDFNGETTWSVIASDGVSILKTFTVNTDGQSGSVTHRIVID